mgnify:CR=1 FL=1
MVQCRQIKQAPRATKRGPGDREGMKMENLMWAINAASITGSISTVRTGVYGVVAVYADGRYVGTYDFDSGFYYFNA